ncbi:MAG: group 1 truncated hemoglobin [Acidimicrobiia bacterium]
MTLYDKYGHFKVNLVAHQLYADVVTDRRLAPFFRDVSIPMLVEHQAIFLATILGGPDKYTSEDIRRAHADRGIGPDDFEILIDYLKARLTDNDFEPADVDDIIATYRTFQGFVTGEERRSGDG